MENAETASLLSQAENDPGIHWLSDPLGLHGSFALKPGSNYQVVASGKNWQSALARELSDPDALIASAQAKIIKVDPRRIVAQVNVQGMELILKLYRDTGSLRRLAGRLRGSRAMRVAEGTRLMSDAGFCAPELLAVLETPGRQNSCVVNRVVEGPTLEVLWRDANGQQRHQIASDFACYLRAVHDCGIYPQDIKSPNFIARRESANWQFCLVDLDAVKQFAKLSQSRIQKNLIQIERSIGREASRTQRLRLLKAYMGRPDAQQLRHQIRQLLIAVQRKEADVQAKKPKKVLLNSGR